MTWTYTPAGSPLVMGCHGFPMSRVRRGGGWEAWRGGVSLDGGALPAGRPPAGDALPRLSHVARAVDVGIEILELVPIDARVRDVRVVSRRFEHRHAAPRCQPRRRGAAPGLPRVRGGGEWT